ncbi:arsenate reductase (glutaredoxin) [Sungkyunkwania multivorans]|uniref:Arsenate reductase (Glutaredoxin) n=1 Tax=Sungkyunkwania multivorans TaxID=1173618 RepID=A0ABW3CVG0_9FLAO
MIKIYHNPRCSKSRQGLSILEESGQPYEVRKYLEDVPTAEELREVLSLLNITADQLVRKNEAVWKEKYRSRLLSEEDIIEAMVHHPKLIERPIVVKGNKAVIGRPPEAITDII